MSTHESVLDCRPVAYKLASQIKERWRQGEPADVLGVLSRHQELQGKKSILIDLAYEEYCRRRDAGEVLDPDAFCDRFPALKTSLRRLLSVHGLVEKVADRTGAGVARPAEGPEPPWPEPGETFLGFRLHRELGQGAFARVFLASEPALGDRPVAVKVALSGAAEAEILGRLRHPNIVPVYSIREDESSGLSAVCMPYLGSATLCDVLDLAFARPGLPDRARLILDAVRDRASEGSTPGDGALPARVLRKGTYIDGVLHIAAQLADALAAAHALGIHHRDLKPSNVLVTADGRPMLLDFNLAHDERLATNFLGGTIPYMSPEQLLATDRERRADHSLLDARSDLFSLGVILYELLTGAHPFGPTSLNLGERQLRKQLLERQRDGPGPVRQHNADVDAPLARLLERCLAYNPKDRPQSAAELAVALRQGLSPLRRVRRWARRHPRTLVGTAVFILSVGLGGAYLWSLRAPESVRELHRGLEAYQQRQYSQAVQHLNRVLEADPGRADALFARGRAFQQLGESDERNFRLALADYQQADGLAPDGRTKACMGYCLGRMGLPDAAILECRRAIEAGFATAEVYNNLGRCALAVSRLDEAQKALDQALALDPDLVPARHSRALLALQRAHDAAQLLDGSRLCGRSGAARATDIRGAELGKEDVRRQMTGYLNDGLADIRKALELRPLTPELCYDAARLEALAAQLEARGVEPALKYLALAVEHGCDPGQMKTDLFLTALRDDPRFRALVDKPALPHPPQADSRLVDPVKDAFR